MQITITGLSGSGNSTVAKLLAKKLNYKHYSAGDFRRQLAKERNLTLMELNKLGEKESWTDIEADKISEKIGNKEKNFVMDAKVGFHFVPNSVKIIMI